MDCTTSLKQVIACCQKLGINCVALADHGTVAGALKLKEIAPFEVIVAEEILTTHGEIMGMFLIETIPSGQSVCDTVSQIKSQGGLVCIPHPFDKLRHSALDSHKVEEIIEQIDIIEVFNARSPLPMGNNRALAFAQKYGIPGSAGSDAHTTQEIGNACIELPEFNDKDGFLQALAKGKINGHRTSPVAHLGSIWARVRKRL